MKAKDHGFASPIEWRSHILSQNYNICSLERIYFLLITSPREGREIMWWVCSFVCPTAAVPANEVEAVVRSPTNMAAAKIAAVDLNKMTSKWRHSTGGLLTAMFVGEDLLANRRLQTLLLLWLDVRNLVCPFPYLRNRTAKLHQIFCARCLWLCLGPPLMASRYVTYFRFCGWRHVSHNGLYDASRAFLSDESAAAETIKSI